MSHPDNVRLDPQLRVLNMTCPKCGGCLVTLKGNVWTCRECDATWLS